MLKMTFSCNPDTFDLFSEGKRLGHLHFPDHLKEHVFNPTNTKLPGIVENDIQNILRPLKHQLALLHTEIYDNLLPQHTKLTNLINDLSVGVAPHKNLPTELLSHIFRETLSDDPSVYIPLCWGPGSHQRGCVPLPWSLTHVCKSWRDVALREPALWSSIRLYHPEQYNEAALETVLETVLDRSRSLPIELHIRWNRFRARGSYSTPRVISLNTQRLSRLSFEGLQRDISDFLSMLAPDGVQLRALEELEIINLGSSVDSPRRILGNPIQYAPLLRKFSFTMAVRTPAVAEEFIRDLGIPLGTLTELNLSFFVPFRVIYPLLAQAPNLQSSTFSADDRFDDPIYGPGQTPVDIITLPHLQDLTVAYTSPKHEPIFLRYLCLPSLRRLDLSPSLPCAYHLSSEGPPLSHLLDFINRSGCQLEVFGYDRVCNLDPILEHLHSSLLHLNAPRAFLWSGALQLVARGEYEPHFLQKSTFRVHPSNFEALLNMLESVLSRGVLRRWEMTVCIRTLWGDRTEFDRDDLLRQFSTLQERFEIEGSIALSFN